MWLIRNRKCCGNSEPLMCIVMHVPLWMPFYENWFEFSSVMNSMCGQCSICTHCMQKSAEFFYALSCTKCQIRPLTKTCHRSLAILVAHCSLSILPIGSVSQSILDYVTMLRNSQTYMVVSRLLNDTQHTRFHWTHAMSVYFASMIRIPKQAPKYLIFLKASSIPSSLLLSCHAPLHLSLLPLVSLVCTSPLPLMCSLSLMSLFLYDTKKATKYNAHLFHFQFSECESLGGKDRPAEWCHLFGHSIIWFQQNAIAVCMMRWHHLRVSCIHFCVHREDVWAIVSRIDISNHIIDTSFSCHRFTTETHQISKSLVIQTIRFLHITLSAHLIFSTFHGNALTHSEPCSIVSHIRSQYLQMIYIE